MITSQSFSIFVVTTVIAIFTGFLWQDEYTVNLHGKYIRFFFRGNFRSLLTAHIILLSGFLVFLWFNPLGEMPEILGILSGGEVMLLGTAFGGFLNWRVGHWSFAPRHSLVITRLVALSEKDALDESLLRIHLLSMIDSISKGNVASQKQLHHLIDRDDRLGVLTQNILIDLGYK